MRGEIVRTNYVKAFESLWTSTMVAFSLAYLASFHLHINTVPAVTFYALNFFFQLLPNDVRNTSAHWRQLFGSSRPNVEEGGANDYILYLVHCVAVLLKLSAASVAVLLLIETFNVLGSLALVIFGTNDLAVRAFMSIRTQRQFLIVSQTEARMVAKYAYAMQIAVTVGAVCVYLNDAFSVRGRYVHNDERDAAQDSEDESTGDTDDDDEDQRDVCETDVTHLSDEDSEEDLQAVPPQEFLATL